MHRCEDEMSEFWCCDGLSVANSRMTVRQQTRLAVLRLFVYVTHSSSLRFETHQLSS
ncbi:MAG: hypothetical protein ACKERG_04705 [Candidatus Hodgkinia cicadicola]